MTHYTAEQLASFPWIVSTDTLRNEDLLVRYWQAAEQCHAIKYSGHPFAAEHPALVQQLERLAGEDSKESDWNEEQAAQCVDDLAEILQDYAPAGFGFGASIGDGACFGFWIGEEWAEALKTLGFGYDDPTGWAELISRLELDGIDPENIEDAYQGRAEGYSEEQAGAEFAQGLAEEQGLMPQQPGWPFSCIDWLAAWRELEIGDGYLLHDIGGEYLVFRSV